MGIIVDPGIDLYCPWDNDAFPPGKSPLKLYLKVEGVIKGPDWLPGCGEPNNGNFVLYQENSYAWRCGGEYSGARFFAVYPDAWVRVFTDEGILCFLDHQYLPTDFLYPENLTWEFFTGGMATISCREPVGKYASFQNICKLIGLNVNRKTFVESFIGSNGERVSRYAKQEDGTCITVKINI